LKFLEACCYIGRTNATREVINRRLLEEFAKERNQKILMFPATFDLPLGSYDRAAVASCVLCAPETSKWKGSGFFLHSQGMPSILLKNENTAMGLVNGCLGTIDNVVVEETDKSKGIILPSLCVRVWLISLSSYI
jgi:hypothetical protein